MDLRPRQIALYAVLAIVGVLALAAVIEAAGETVAVAVAIGAIATLVGSYGWTAVLSFRSAGQKQVSEQTMRWMRVHMASVCCAPLVLIAAHPWGPATLAIAFGVVVVCHFLYIHVLLVAGFVMHRRARKSRPA